MLQRSPGSERFLFFFFFANLDFTARIFVGVWGGSVFHLFPPCVERPSPDRPQVKIPKDRIKAALQAEMKQKEKLAKKRGETTTVNPFFQPDNKGPNRHRRQLPEYIAKDFQKIQNGTYFDQVKGEYPVYETEKKKPKTTVTTQTPFPSE